MTPPLGAEESEWSKLGWGGGGGGGGGIFKFFTEVEKSPIKKSYNVCLAERLFQ